MTGMSRDELVAIAREADAAADRTISAPGAVIPVERDIFDRTAEFVGVVLLVALVGIVFINAVGRYLFSYPLVWVEELSGVLMIWVIIIGAFLANHRRQLIVSRTVIEMMPDRWRKAIELLSEISATLVFGWIAWLGLQYAGFFGSDPTPVLGLPKIFYMASIPIGLFAIAVANFIPIIERFKDAVLSGDKAQ